MHTFWTTFYSYKGGVGRSMALANVAAYLAESGRRVLMVDFDLEAPGLDSFEEFHVPPGKEGLVEYVCHYLENGSPPPVSGYVHEIKPSEEIPGQIRGRRLDGKLWLMTSGAKNESYNRKRLSIDWADLYESKAGALFFENLKADIEDTFRPDYVLVDSRTGLTDVGGVCTLHLPDLVVLLFSLNEQNLNGIASVARVLRDSQKQPQLFPVATPVPNLPREENGALDQRYERARELLGVEVSLALPYSPSVAIREQVLVWRGRTQLTDQYEALAKRLKESEPAGIDYLCRSIESAIDGFELQRAEDLSRALEADYGDRAEAWLSIADVAKAMGNAKAYERALEKSVELSGRHTKAFERLQNLLHQQKRIEDLLPLLRRLLQSENMLDNEFAARLHNLAGEILLKWNQPREALEHSEASLRALIAADCGEAGDVRRMWVSYNIAESRRRAFNEIRPDEWRQVISSFEKLSAWLSSLPVHHRAHLLQAMHVAYACAGDIDRAKSLLDQTEKIISKVALQARIFCVAAYDFLSTSEFKQRNQSMRAALDKWCLWDGRILPASNDARSQALRMSDAHGTA